MYRRLFLSGLVLCVLPSLLLLISSVRAESTWSQTYGGAESSESAWSVIASSEGGYAICGSTAPSGTLSYDFWLVKTDSNGAMEWNRSYGGWGSERALSLVATSDGGYALAGEAKPFGSGYPPYYNYTSCLVKTDAVGNFQWNKTYGKGTTDYVTSLATTLEGGYIMAGRSFLIRTDAFGNTVWNKTYPAVTGWMFNGKWSVVVTSDGGYALAGHSMADFLLLKTDRFGNMIWNRTYGGTESDYANSLIATSDGGYAMAGVWNITDYSRSGGTEADFYMVKTDGSGNMQWNKTYGITGINYANSLVETSDGGYVLAGYTYSTAGKGDCLVIGTDSFGNMLWNRTLGGAESDSGQSLVAAADGGLVIAGSTNSFDAGSGDFWLIKTDEFGVVPEFPSWLTPTLILFTTGFFAAQKKRVLRLH